MKKLLLLFMCVCSLSLVYAGPKEQLVYRAATEKWYAQPAFWIVIVAIALCVVIYNIVKDKK